MLNKLVWCEIETLNAVSWFANAVMPDLLFGTGKRKYTEFYYERGVVNYSLLFWVLPICLNNLIQTSVTHTNASA